MLPCFVQWQMFVVWLRDGVGAPLRHTRARRPLPDAPCTASVVVRRAAAGPPLPVASRNPVNLCPDPMVLAPTPIIPSPPFLNFFWKRLSARLLPQTSLTK